MFSVFRETYMSCFVSEKKTQKCTSLSRSHITCATPLRGLLIDQQLGERARGLNEHKVETTIYKALIQFTILNGMERR